MTNLTLTIDETLLRKARIKALERGTSVNAMVRDFIEKTVADDAPNQTRAELFMQIIEQGKFAFTGPRMTREEMYESEPRYQHPRRNAARAPAPGTSATNRS
jgi:Family of unknown function (DUF6364)